MKVRKNSLSIFALACMSAWCSILMFYYQNGISLSTVPVAFLDAALKSMTLIIVTGLVDETASQKKFYSGASFMLMAATLYNQNSVTKYAVQSLYDGAISSNFMRFCASQYVNFIIIAAALVWRKIHRINTAGLKNNRFDFKAIAVPKWLVFSIIAVYVILQIVSTKVSFSRTMGTIVLAINCLTYAVVVLYVQLDGREKLRQKSMMPIYLLAAVNLFITMKTGGKQIIVIYALVIGCGLVYLGKIEYKLLRIACALSPLLLEMITQLSELVSGRMRLYPGEIVLRYHVFRYDLADLAFTISMKFGRITEPLMVLKEALLVAIPSVIIRNKPEELISYQQQFNQIGMDGMFDYNDTFFSMGAQLFGFIGMLLVFVGIVWFYEWLSVKIVNIKRIGPPMLLLLIRYFVFVESDWSMFVSNTRDIIVYLLLGWIIFRVSVKIRERRKRL